MKIIKLIMKKEMHFVKKQPTLDIRTFVNVVKKHMCCFEKNIYANSLICLMRRKAYILNEKPNGQ